MDDKQLAKLIRQTVAKADKTRNRPPARTYDSTLTRKEIDNADIEREQFFDEMKRREF